jgi:O-antigen/teichoic acid export membrane protein
VAIRRRTDPDSRGAMAARKPSGLALARRFSWAFGDQILSSLTNFALGFLVARSVSVREFGAFSLAFTTYTLALAASRALSTEPLLIRYGHVPREVADRGISSATGMATATGFAVGVCCIVVAALNSGPLASSFVALGTMLPGLLLQDSWRYSFFASERGRSAFLNDLLWAVLLVPGVLLFQANNLDSVGWMVWIWGGTAAIAGVVGMLQSRVLPRPHRAHRWLIEQRDLAPRFLGEFALSSGTTQTSIYGIGLIAGLRTVAAIKAAQLMLGPINVIFLGSDLVAVPEAVKTLKTRRHRFLRRIFLLSSALGVAALMWGVVALVMPDSIGRELLGPSWDAGHSIIVPMSLAVAGFGFLVGPMAGLRALEAAKRSLRARFKISLLGVVGGLGGAAVAGANGVAWAYAAVAAINIAIYWRELFGALSDYRGAQSEEKLHDQRANTGS